MKPPPVFGVRAPAKLMGFRPRCVVAIVIGGLGFWLPFLWDLQFPAEADSRLGIVYLWTIPLILAAAVWASVAVRSEARPRVVSMLLMFLVWSPILFFALFFGIALARIFFYLLFQR